MFPRKTGDVDSGSEKNRRCGLCILEKQMWIRDPKKQEIWIMDPGKTGDVGNGSYKTGDVDNVS